MKYLTPLILREYYYATIEAEIKRTLNVLFYIPLFKNLALNKDDIAKITEKKNSVNALLSAIRSGTIWYDDGQFKGQYNISITKELRAIDAQFSYRTKTWYLTQDKVPSAVKFAQATADSRYESMRLRLLEELNTIDAQRVDTISDTQTAYEKSLHKMEGDLHKTIPLTDSMIAIEAELTADQIRIIARDWSQNLNLYIKNWSEENIIELREKIQPHILGGGRAQGLIKIIEDNYGVATRKAKFLARQETSLLMSKFQESRYKDMGITRYRWSGSNDARERPDHKALNGKIFSWDDPPITDQRTGARNNPGEDYNCRCVAIPIVE